jgi:hypothetical protein
MTNFTVVGFWPDTDERFADSVDADTPAEAEAKIGRSHPGVAIVAVLSGHVVVEDADVLVNYTTP